MSITAQQFRNRILLHRTATRTPLEQRLDTKALARKESILNCPPHIKARCKFWVRALDEQGEQVYADILTIVFDDPRLAQPPTRMFAEAQAVALEIEAKAQWNDIVWDHVAKLVQFKPPEILHYYCDTSTKLPGHNAQLLAGDCKPVASVVDVSKLDTSKEPPAQRDGNGGSMDHSKAQGHKSQSENAQPLDSQEVTTPERTPTAREVLAKLAQNARNRQNSK